MRSYVMVGIRFPGQEALCVDDGELVPQHEPFFFVCLADDWSVKNYNEWASHLPQGWIRPSKNPTMAIICRPLSQFSAEPDERVRELISWAEIEFAKAFAALPALESAPVQDLSKDDVDDPEDTA